MGKRVTHKHGARSSQHRSRIAMIGGGAALAIALGVGVAVFGRSDDASHQEVAESSRRNGSARPVVDLYKSATCGCCSKWVDHLREHGFTVRPTDTEALASVEASHGVPRQFQSCHTAVVDGYVIEGHVPAADVQRLLRERPAMTGLAVAGMPVGSPPPAPLS